MWTAFRAIDDVWGSRCESTSLAELRTATKDALDRLAKIDRDAAWLLSATVDRIDRYEGMCTALAKLETRGP